MKTQIFMNKPVYLGLSILEESNIAIYDFWYDYVKPKCGEKLRLYLFKLQVKLDTDSLRVYTTKDV